MIPESLLDWKYFKGFEIRELKSCFGFKAFKNVKRAPKGSLNSILYPQTSISTWFLRISSKVSRLRISLASPLITSTSAGRKRLL